MNAVAPLIPCIVSGGSGTRLWPVSRESMPKPFMRLADDQSLLQKTFLRIAGLPDVARRHCCKVSDEAAFCLIQRPYVSKTLLTRRISPRGSP